MTLVPVEREEVVCRRPEVDMDWWTSDDLEDVAQAVAGCHRCPEEQACLIWALKTRQQGPGVLGGIYFSGFRTRGGAVAKRASISIAALQLTADELRRIYLRIPSGEGCREWTGDTNAGGYGRFAIYRGGRRIRVLPHRVVLFLKLGREPSEVTRHTCDNPPCCQPDHLLEGSQSDNMRDARDRGRIDYAGLRARQEAQDRVFQERVASGVKTCPRCHQSRPLEDYYRNRAAADGRQDYCKFCAQAKNAVRRAS